jgi:CheY-like chemotaxis protein
VLSITDTGTGMDSDTEARLFEPFFTTKPPGKGTGLGLPTVYGVVQQSEGAISVETEPGRGTTFKIFLPRCAEHASSTHTPPSPSTEMKGHETILLVEDQEAIREVTVEYLGRLGYEVLAAADGEAALKIVGTQTKTIGLLVTDVVMPNMGGPELAARITQLSPRTKVLFMSGYPDRAIRQHEGMGEDAEILQKPFSLKKLASKARSLLDRSAHK